jgi:hypothetical protein
MAEELNCITTAPRDRWIMLSGGGWTCAMTGAETCEPAVARWLGGTWAMRDHRATFGYENPSCWAEIEP